MKTRDWLTGYDVRGRVLSAGRSADALKAEKPGPVHSVDEIPGRSEVVLLLSRLYTQTSSWPSTALTTDTSAGSIRVGLRVTKVPSM